MGYLKNCFYLIICFNFVVDGNWGEWLFWIVCIKFCGVGVRMCVRLCDNLILFKDGRDCIG